MYVRGRHKVIGRGHQRLAERCFRPDDQIDGALSRLPHGVKRQLKMLLHDAALFLQVVFPIGKCMALDDGDARSSWHFLLEGRIDSLHPIVKNHSKQCRGTNHEDRKFQPLLAQGDQAVRKTGSEQYDQEGDAVLSE